jgi:hypothetical protein
VWRLSCFLKVSQFRARGELYEAGGSPTHYIWKSGTLVRRGRRFFRSLQGILESPLMPDNHELNPVDQARAAKNMLLLSPEIIFYGSSLLSS